MRINPSVPMHFIVTNDTIDPKYAILALDKLGKYDGHNVGMDIMQCQMASHTLVDIVVGFTWPSSDQKVFVAPPQMILPKI